MDKNVSDKERLYKIDVSFDTIRKELRSQLERDEMTFRLYNRLTSYLQEIEMTVKN